MKKIDAFFRAIFVFFCLTFILGTTALAAINPQIDFYGTLQNDSGVNLTGTYDIVFRIYDAPTGGTLLGTNTHTAANGNPVNVRNGKFAVVLGSGTGNSLAGIDFNSSTLYVGLTINADSEMVPRERMTAAPYAFNSERLEGYSANQLLRYNATGSMTQSSTDTILSLRQNGAGNILSLFGGATEMFTVLSNGNVGIGTTTPGRDLSVSGDVQIVGGLYDSLNSAGTVGMVLQTTGTTTRWVATSTLGITGGGGSSLFTDGGATTYLTALGDNLGIGTLSASAKLTVAGDGFFGGNLIATGSLAISGLSTLATTTISSSTITSLNLINSLALTSGGTGATTATGARTNLGATTVGSNIFTLTNPGALSFLRINADNTVTAVATSTLGIALADTAGILDVNRGGTGAVTLTGLLQGNGTGPVTGVTGTAGQVPYYNGVNTLSATSSIFLDTNGNFGIGTTTPAQKLHVEGNIQLASDGKIDAGTIGNFTLGNDAHVFIDEDTGLVFNDNGRAAYDFRIESDTDTHAFILNATTGNIGIGSTSPSAKLTVAGSGYFGGNLTATGTLTISGISTLATTTITNLTLAQALAVTSGGTGLSSYATGDLIYASGVNTLANRAIGTTGQVLQVVGGLPTWVATSSLGITGGGGSSLFTDGGATTYLTALGDNLAIGTTTATAKLFIQSDPGITDVFAIASSSGASLMRIQRNGDVAIGLNATVGNSAFSNYLTAIGDNAGAGAIFAFGTNLIGKNAGFGAEYIVDSNAIGVDAGFNASSSDTSNFIGYQAGYGAGYASAGNFIGWRAGFNSLYTSDVTAIGTDAGRDANGTSFATFIGRGAGGGATDVTSVIFMGEYAGSGATNVYNSSFIGGYAGASATGSDNAIFIGSYAGQNDTVVNTGTETSILIGESSGTGGFSNSIAIGARVVNSAESQLNIGNLLFGTGIYSNFVRSGAPVAGGRIGIGTSTPGSTLTVEGTFLTTGTSSLATTTISGRLGIGTTTPTAQLTTTGTVRLAAFGAGTLQTDASGNVSVSSDERLKDIQGEFSKGLEALALINPIQYTWKPTTGYDTANVYTGFSAQNIQEALPEAVGKNSDGYLSLSDRPLLATVINAIKEIYAWMKTTDTRVETLQTQINSMQAEIEDLKAGKTQTSNTTANTPPNPAPDEPDTQRDDTTTPQAPVEEIPAEPVVVEQPSESNTETDTGTEIDVEEQIEEPATETL